MIMFFQCSEARGALQGALQALCTPWRTGMTPGKVVTSPFLPAASMILGIVPK